MMIRIVCMHCQRYMGEKDGKGVEGVSHSCCPECYELYYGEKKGS